MQEASQVITEIISRFPQKDEEVLLALEHFDDQYVQAIAYRTKALRQESPVAVLLIDIGAHSLQQIESGKQRIATVIAQFKNTSISVAADSKALS